MSTNGDDASWAPWNDVLKLVGVLALVLVTKLLHNLLLCHFDEQAPVVHRVPYEQLQEVLSSNREQRERKKDALVM